ncbi:STAS domain-containing protein [Guptibacillus algicola]|uniref:STAS domain-containing protein n=1 Tax=Guptibacillus algicola TaxID=225844 RepID=UPI001CD5FB2F|nr:STAS domain-containing protein [Alkalihalobacillus algicola]MCA0989338.1 PAS domain-containing protein [Alkalihalobacillus algicola]
MAKTSFFEKNETVRVLNSIGDSIFICDTSFNIAWFNEQARALLESIIDYLPVDSPSDLIGKSIHDFHKNPIHQTTILLHQLPYQSTITLFDKFAANIVISEYKDEHEEKQGYILVWRDVTEKQKEMDENRKLIDEYSNAILPTVLDNAILIPLIGTLTVRRSEKLIGNVLDYCAKTNTDYVLIDFSGLTNLSDRSANTVFETMTKSLKLMGIHVVYVGITSRIVKWIIDLDLDSSVPTFATFRQGIHDVMKSEGFILKKIDDK